MLKSNLRENKATYEKKKSKSPPQNSDSRVIALFARWIFSACNTEEAEDGPVLVCDSASSA